MLDKLIEQNLSLQTRVQELEAAIFKHKSQTGNNLCWENDRELWSVIGESNYPHESLPEKEEFLRNCNSYYESRKTS